MSFLAGAMKIRQKSRKWRQQYGILLNLEKYADAKQVAEDLFNVLNEENFVGHEAESAADFYRNKSQYFDAILLYHVAFKLYELQNKQRKVLDGVKECAWGTELVVYDMKVKKQPGHRSVVTHYVLPLMSEMKQSMKLANVEDPDHKASQIASCKHYIEVVKTLQSKQKSNRPHLHKGCQLM